MTNTPKLSLNVYPSDELRHALDRWRIEQPDAPSRAEACRRLLEKTLMEQGLLKQPRKRKGKGE
jgi:hypothetical protein